MKFISASIVLITFTISTNAQRLILKDSVNIILGDYSPGSKIKKQSIITANKIFLEYNDGDVPEYDFYLTTGVTTPFIQPGIYGSLLNFNFRRHIGNLSLTEEAAMVFDVKRLTSKNGAVRFNKGAIFYIVE